MVLKYDPGTHPQFRVPERLPGDPQHQNYLHHKTKTKKKKRLKTLFPLLPSHALMNIHWSFPEST